ncbi:hypothetical protein PINS_up004194 [Pythium insidiosum]|nr:hypothetical protein PINS_up004194 [Pythium insidiosum]
MAFPSLQGRRITSTTVVLHATSKRVDILDFNLWHRNEGVAVTEDGKKMRKLA